MKKLLFCLVLAVALVALVGSAQAGVVKGSLHDLSTNNTRTSSTSVHLTGGTGYATQVCRFCHAPHGNSTVAPLWARVTDNTGYTMYSSATMDMTIAGAPQGVSLACLSCHDGVTALDAFLSAPYKWPSGAVDGNGTVIGKNLTQDGSHYVLGKDLTGDHPISITYDTSKDAAFNAASATSTGRQVVGTLPLYGSGKDQVECGSCHNPHDFDTAKPFLRMSNDNSAMCLTCHIK